MGFIDRLKNKTEGSPLFGEGARNDNALAGDESSISDIGASSRARADVAREYTGRQTYIVQAGDTLASIADQAGVSLSDLCGINNIVDTVGHNLYPGRALIIPS